LESEIFFTIYKITNTINNKYYIGKHQTKNLKDGYFGSGKLLKRAIQKYGIENFKKEILYIFETEEEMNAKEKELVVISEETYNLCDGGKGGFGYINSNNLAVNINNQKINSKNRNKKIAISIKNAWINGSYRNTNFHNENKFSGKKHSLETKEKLKKAGMRYIGDKNSQYGTCWITNGKFNKKIKKEDFNNWKDKGFFLGRI
jgi:hypothetical protein